MILEGNYIIFNIWTNTKIFCIKESAASKLLSWYSYMTLSIIYVSITSNTNKYQQTNIFVYNLNYKKFQRTHTDFEEVNFKNYGSLGFGDCLVYDQVIDAVEVLAFRLWTYKISLEIFYTLNDTQFLALSHNWRLC